MEETKDYEALPVEQTEVQIVPLDELERANVDVQVSTAKRYPRDMRRSVNNSIVMATMNEEVARSCGYARREARYRPVRPSGKNHRFQLGKHAYRSQSRTDHRQAGHQPGHGMGSRKQRGLRL